MSNADRDAAEIGPSETPSRATQPPLPSCGASELKYLLEVVAEQISAADRRHADALHDMQERLRQLGDEARTLRPQMAGEFAPAFGRIEDALTHLADKLSVVEEPAGSPPDQGHGGEHAVTGAMDPAREPSPFALQNPPMALRSAAAGASAPLFPRPSEHGRLAPKRPEIDPFDVVDASSGPGSSPVWTRDEAEALTRIYESESQPVVFAETHEGDDIPSHDVAPSRAFDHANDSPEAHTVEDRVDRSWMEARFADIAARIEEALVQQPHENAFDVLNDRLSVLEERFSVTIVDAVSQADSERLQVIAEHIEGLTSQIDHARAELSRLDMIESQLAAVADHLASHESHSSDTSGAIPAHDLERLAELAAADSVQRFASTFSSNSNDDRLAEINDRLAEFMTSQRQGEEQTLSLLDTMQQALIRVLDRIDAMEVAQPAPAIGQISPLAPAFGRLQSGPVMDRGVYADDTEGPLAVQTASYPPAPVAPAPAVMAAPQSVPELIDTRVMAGKSDSPPVNAAVTNIERLRQEFIAEAQRAKLKAAAEGDAGATATANSKPGAKMSRIAAMRAKTGDGTAPSKIFGMSPKLLAAALAVVVVINGVLLLTSRQPSPEPAAAPAPAQVGGSTQAKPSQAGTAASPVTPATGKPASDVPGPRSELPADGSVSEAPAAGAAKSVSGGFAFDSDNDAPQASSAVAGSAPSHISNVPEGIRLREPDAPPVASEIYRLQQQHSQAQASSRLGAEATRLSPAAFIPDAPADAVASANGSVVPPQAPTGRTSALDLPPVTVGPLSLRLAAANGDPSAQFEAASRLAEGKGTNQNFKEAIRWYQRAAAQGFAQAQYRLGTLYERGLGVKADAGHARDWYQRAAELGNVKAMHNLAVLSAGREQVSPDYVTAAKWFDAAANRGLYDSQYNLGVLFESGMGVAQDQKTAYKWFTLAARSGDGEAIRRRDTLKAQLAPQDLAEAEAAASAFAPVPLDPLANDARVAGEDWKKRIVDGTQG